MGKYEYVNDVQYLDQLAEKMAKGIFPAVDEFTLNEVEIRMRELASDVIDMDDLEDDEDFNEIMEKHSEIIRGHIEDQKRKATTHDVAVFELTDEQKKQILDDCRSSYVRPEPSDYNSFNKGVDKEKELLDKRVAGLRNCYYNAPDYINAVNTYMECVKYSLKHDYPWLSESEAVRMFNNGEIQINVQLPKLYLNYNTMITDPEILKGIWTGEISIISDKDNEISRKNYVKDKDAEGVVIDYDVVTGLEYQAMSDMASQGYDTPCNTVMNSASSIYSRFIPESKRKYDPVEVKNFFRDLKEDTKITIMNEEKPIGVNEVISYVQKDNNNDLNQMLSTNMDKFMVAISKPTNNYSECAYTERLQQHKQEVNAKAAKVEADIMAAIKSVKV